LCFDGVLVEPEALEPAVHTLKIEQHVF